MKQIHIALIALTLGLLASSCRPEEVFKHYVQTYALEVYEEDDPDYPSIREHTYNPNILCVSLRVNYKKPNASVSWQNVSKEEYNEYLKYARENNDLAWNKKADIYSLTYLNYIYHYYSAHQVVDITVKAETDWDETTPKGSILNDKFLFLSFSPDEYLRNGYYLDTKKIDKIRENVDPRLMDDFDSYNDNSMYTKLPVYGLLSEINFTEYKLFGIGGIWFELLPINEQTKGTTMSVNITFDNGKKAKYMYTYK